MKVKKQTCPYCKKKNVDGRHTVSCPKRPEAMGSKEYIYNSGPDDPSGDYQDNVNNIDQVIDNDNPLSIREKPVINGETGQITRKAGRPPGSRNRGDVFKQFQNEIDNELLKLCLGKTETVTCPACNHKFERTGKPDREALIHVDNRLKGKISATSSDPNSSKLELSNSELVKISLSVLEQIARYEDQPIDTLLAQVVDIAAQQYSKHSPNETVKAGSV